MFSLGKETINKVESDPIRRDIYEPYQHQQDCHDFHGSNPFNSGYRRPSPSSLALRSTPASLDDHILAALAPSSLPKPVPFDDFASTLSTNHFDSQSWPRANAKRWKSVGSSRESLPGTSYASEGLEIRRASGSQASTPSQMGSPTYKQLHSTPSSRASLAVPFTPPNSLKEESDLPRGPLTLESLHIPLKFDFGPESAFFESGNLQSFMTPPLTASQYQDTFKQENELGPFPDTLHSGVQKGPDLFASATENVSDPPMEDLCPVNEELRPHQQDLRFDGDLYTPRWVRGSGHKREGWCGMCKPGKWLILKNSAYWYDKCFAHGICPPTGQLFAEPAQFRRSSDNQDIWEGFCGECNQWITLVSSKRKGTSWFRHVAKVSLLSIWMNQADFVQSATHKTEPARVRKSEKRVDTFEQPRLQTCPDLPP